MAIEKTIVEQGLESRGLDLALADNFTFETEDSMNSTLDSFKPRTFENIEDVMKDENLSKMIRTYGDKRLSDFQSKFDKDKDKDKGKDKDEDKDKDKGSDEPPAWAKAILDRQEKLEAQSAAKEFENILNNVGKAEGLNATHINRVKKGLKSDATEAEIKAEISSYKKEMAELGIKEFGTPGAGGKGNSSIEAAAKSWAKKNTKNKK